ncbi:uncharacterized protein [Amphiura filiformis]|uniref:uncharacterized protein n=1 Tax=Amphiura filiformis TaxID=82378 RepID=UPI003B214906
MRVFGCLLLACLVIGAYGAAKDLLENRSGGNSDDPDICAVKDGSVTFVYLPRPQPQAADDVTKRGHGGQNKFKLILQYLITEYSLIGNVSNCGVVDVADFVCVDETKNAWKIRFEGDPRADEVFNAVDNACE